MGGNRKEGLERWERTRKEQLGCRMTSIGMEFVGIIKVG